MLTSHNGEFLFGAYPQIVEKTPHNRPKASCLGHSNSNVFVRFRLVDCMCGCHNQQHRSLESHLGSSDVHQILIGTIADPRAYLSNAISCLSLPIMIPSIHENISQCPKALTLPRLFFNART